MTCKRPSGKKYYYLVDEDGEIEESPVHHLKNTRAFVAAQGNLGRKIWILTSSEMRIYNRISPQGYLS